MKGDIMIERFSPKTIKNYVYMYSDPDSEEPFYVGKGQGNRVFDHLKEPANKDQKTKKINALKRRGKKPKIEILAYGLDSETAKKVEAAVIDALDISKLTNKVRGYDSVEFGKIEVDVLESRCGSELLKRSDITDNVIIFRITDTYHENMTGIELYDATRQYWKVSMKSVDGLDYALAVHDGIVLEVYKIEEWYPAFSTFTTRPGYELLQPEENPKEKFYEFIGRVAEDKIRRKYKGKSIKGMFKVGNCRGFNYIRGKKE